MTPILLSEFGITPAQFADLAGGERLAILAHLERRGIEQKLAERTRS